MIRSLLLVLMLCLPLPARAVEPTEMLADPVLEARAREISKGLRCLVCRNESIDDSNAALAKDLRLLVREQISAGKTDEQVVNFIVERYGEYVLLRPRFSGMTALLWLAPLGFLGLGLAAASIYLRRRSSELAPPPLSAEEEARLAALLGRK